MKYKKYTIVVSRKAKETSNHMVKFNYQNFLKFNRVVCFTIHKTMSFYFVAFIAWPKHRGHTMRHSAVTGVLSVPGQKMQQKHIAAAVMPEHTQLSTDHKLPDSMQTATTSLSGGFPWKPPWKAAVDCSNARYHYCQKLGAAHHHHHTSSLGPVISFRLFF